MRKAAVPLLLALLEAPTPAIELARLEELLGFTHWDCAEKFPVAWVRIYFRGGALAMVDADGNLNVTPGFLETVAHEMKHLQQTLASSDCEAWKAKLADEEYREEAEREATCAGMTLGRQAPCNAP